MAGNAVDGVFVADPCRAAQAKKMYESERESIEAQYWDAREQVRNRLLTAVEERRRKLREEKEGGDIVTGEPHLTSSIGSVKLTLGRSTPRSTDQTPPLSPNAIPESYLRSW